MTEETESCSLRLVRGDLINLGFPKEVIYIINNVRKFPNKALLNPGKTTLSPIFLIR